LLDKAASDGLITNYSGVRMSSTGKKFRVENATVWTMTNGDGVKTGQAVRFEKVVRLNADGSDGDAMVVNENGEWVKDVVASPAEDKVVDVDAVKALVAELSAQVEAQAAVVRELKDNGGTNADDDVKAAVSVLLDVKAKLSEAEAKLA
jgi:Cys-tRNA synthase (O-phospho-L-seryl-tRNA:Cys-tRNA synthase)